MKPIRELISRDVIDDLWGAGYTILPRRRHPDPFHVPDDMVPQGRSYQWMHLIEDKVWYSTGWAAVPASRHDGYFMPAGHIGDIEVNGLGLFEKPKFEVERDRAEHASAAQRQVDDWVKRSGTQFLGEISVNGERTEIGETKSFENITAIPRDLVPYIAEIFTERDKITGQYASESQTETWTTRTMEIIHDAMGAAMKADQNQPKWPALNAIVLPLAIQNIRSRIKEEASNGD